MMPDTQTPAKKESTNAVGMLLRLFWMVIGNMVLVMVAVSIIENRQTFLSIADILYVVLVPLLIVARYLDIKFFEGATASGEPATIKHWRKYALTTASVAVAVWFAAHGISRLLAG
jgi:hypothetical protein